MVHFSEPAGQCERSRIRLADFGGGIPLCGHERGAQRDEQFELLLVPPWPFPGGPGTAPGPDASGSLLPNPSNVAALQLRRSDNGGWPVAPYPPLRNEQPGVR